MSIRAGRSTRMSGIRSLLSVLVVVLVVGQAFAASPERTFARDCAVCHVPGITGAPKLGDKPEWARRVRAGMGMLYRNAYRRRALYGDGRQKGASTDIPDDEIKAIVDYMIDAAALDSSALEAGARYERLGIRDRDFIRLDSDYDGYLSRQEVAGDPSILAS